MMNHGILGKIRTALIFALSIIMAWGGLLYAINDPNRFRLIGVIVSFAGYGVFFWTALRFERDPEKQD